MNRIHSKSWPAPPKKKPLTFGNFVGGGVRAWDECEGVRIIRLAVKVRWLESGGPQRLVIS